MRLNRFLAASGFGSRRACEALIREGKISINGHFIRDLATVVNPGDEVRVAGKPPCDPSCRFTSSCINRKGLSAHDPTNVDGDHL